MYSNNSLASLSIVMLAILTFFAVPVSAFDGGDAAALIIGLVVGFLGICACLGAYARKRSGGMA